eukprot:g16243.t1
MARQQGVAKSGVHEPEFQEALKSLLRKPQMEIISRYGFRASREGIEEMQLELRLLEEDGDIYVNRVAIEEALLGPFEDLTQEEGVSDMIRHCAGFLQDPEEAGHVPQCLCPLPALLLRPAPASGDGCAAIGRCMSPGPHPMKCPLKGRPGRAVRRARPPAAPAAGLSPQRRTAPSAGEAMKQAVAALVVTALCLPAAFGAKVPRVLRRVFCVDGDEMGVQSRQPTTSLGVPVVPVRKNP